MHLGALASHEIHRVMVRTAAHEGKPVLDPVRQPEAEHAAVVFDELLGLVDAERQMAELERADAGDRLVLCDRRLLGEHVDLGAFRVVERHGLGNTQTQSQREVAECIIQVNEAVAVELRARYRARDSACPSVGVAAYPAGAKSLSTWLVSVRVSPRSSSTPKPRTGVRAAFPKDLCRFAGESRLHSLRRFLRML